MSVTGEVFAGKGRELHIAPEGIALTSEGRLVDGDIQRFYAEYAAVDLAEAGGPKGEELTVRFLDGRPSWRVSGMAPEQAQWAEETINEAALAVQQRDHPMFREMLDVPRLGEEIAALGDPSAPRVGPLIDLILVQAILRRASDVHLEPVADRIQVRYRIDGALTDVGSLPLALRERLLGRMKVIGGMVTYRGDVPQEGRSTAQVAGRTVDARISILPTIHGEKATVRLFDPTLAVMPLESLGMAEGDVALFADLLSRPQGTILLTGPAGAGKTTTMYSSLAHIHEQRRSLASICTIEDPVEHDLGIVSQTETDEQAGLTFAAGLRTILRQDPEVIMIGEIRDHETAATAIQAGLTGHLILSTVHARSAAGVFARLIDIGVEPFLVASSVTAVVAQRLVRKVCKACAQPAQPDPALLQRIGLPGTAGASLRTGAGCGQCGRTGYSGRTGVFQVLPVDASLRGLVMRGLPVAELEQEVARLGVASLREAALAKVREGVTAPEEVLRVLGGVEADV
jgi:type II secretory ATPase GspE/PulE/Tfp pilus assembly ATPase PilB-like protein